MPYKKEHICKKCNNIYIANQHNSIYCVNCKNKKKLINNKYICTICKKEFIPTNGTHKKHCWSCKNKFGKDIKNKRWKLWYIKWKNYEPVKEINCMICGNLFLRKSIDQKLCSNNKCKIEFLRKKAKNKYYKNKVKILERRKNNINEMIKLKLRMRVKDAIISKGYKKLYKTMELIGCNIEELKKHLEKQFKPGMSWNNYGKNGWVIDHILPCCVFNLVEEEQQKLCFHYTNLQPLWEKENLSKSGKVEENVC